MGDDRAVLEHVQALEAEVRRLHDREAIRDCIHRYAQGLDRHDEDILASAYHDDAIDRHGEPRSRADFIAWANGFHEADWSAHLHHMTNTRIGIDGDSAWAETYFFAVLKRKDGTMADIGGGRYVDRLERRNGEWRIALRETIVDYQAKLETETFGGTSVYLGGTWDHSDPSYRGTYQTSSGV